MVSYRQRTRPNGLNCFNWNEPFEGDHSHCENGTKTSKLLDIVHGIARKATHKPCVRHVLDELKAPNSYSTRKTARMQRVP